MLQKKIKERDFPKIYGNLGENKCNREKFDPNCATLDLSKRTHLNYKGVCENNNTLVG